MLSLSSTIFRYCKRRSSDQCTSSPIIRRRRCRHIGANNTCAPQRPRLSQLTSQAEGCHSHLLYPHATNNGHGSVRNFACSCVSHLIGGFASIECETSRPRYNPVTSVEVLFRLCACRSLFLSTVRSSPFLFNILISRMLIIIAETLQEGTDTSPPSVQGATAALTGTSLHNYSCACEAHIFL